MAKKMDHSAYNDMIEIGCHGTFPCTIEQSKLMKIIDNKADE
jgi:hypothetical protein